MDEKSNVDTAINFSAMRTERAPERSPAVIVYIALVVGFVVLCALGYAAWYLFAVLV